MLSLIHGRNPPRMLNNRQKAVMCRLPMRKLGKIGLIYQLSGNDTSLKYLTTEEIEITTKE